MSICAVHEKVSISDFLKMYPWFSLTAIQQMQQNQTFSDCFEVVDEKLMIQHTLLWEIAFNSQQRRVYATHS